MFIALFTPFDALFAESLGQKIGLSWAPNKPAKETAAVDLKGEALLSIQDSNKGKSGNLLPSSSQVNKQSQQVQKPRRPRFAPELDGLHFFETIVPY